MVNQIATTPLILRKCNPQELLPLRAKVLRPNLPIQQAIFPQDHHPHTIHWGAFEKDQCICCLSLMLSTFQSQKAYQLRGMATTPEKRNQGIGQQLIHAINQDLHQQNHIQQQWCNARITAIPFYQKLGWRIVSKQFIIPTVGPHKTMAYP